MEWSDGASTCKYLTLFIYELFGAIGLESIKHSRGLTKPIRQKYNMGKAIARGYVLVTFNRAGQDLLILFDFNVDIDNILEIDVEFGV